MSLFSLYIWKFQVEFSGQSPLPLQVSCTSETFLKRLEQWPDEGWLFLHKISSRKNSEGVSKMGNRLVWTAWKIFFLWFKSSSKFGKEDRETGTFEVWHGCKHINVFDYISHVSLFLYLCFYCLFCHTLFVMTLTHCNLHYCSASKL